jgi:hypothetical protein
MDGTVAPILVLVMLFVIVGGPLRPEDWPLSEFKR